MSAEPVRRVGVFCGAKAGHRPGFLDCARELGTALGGSGIGLVYGGSAGGLMGELADAVLRSGGHVIGVIPRHLTQHDPVKTDVDECHLVDTMHERKSTMYRLADSFIALPGGFGTLDELFEILTWRKIGLHRKPIVVLNVTGYFDTLLGMVDHATHEGFVSPDDRHLLSIVDTVAAAVAVVGQAGVTVGS
ncbi:TIGR00730 family Rossman fold protein [Actinophytocola sp.]|uniref:LOG family protein n=1 Tax=Actinophytocola sp. TaxID=1872138 RepID=UPI00389A4D5C